MGGKKLMLHSQLISMDAYDLNGQHTLIIIMKDIKQFFECCTSSITEKEVVINMEHKQRSQSCKTPTKRTFIKRSIGKSTHTDYSAKHTISTTNHSIDNKQNRKHNQIIPIYNSCRTNTSVDSIPSFQNTISNNQTPNNLAPNKEFYKFINYDSNRAKHADHHLTNLNPNIFELYQPQQIPIGIPKLLHDRRYKRQNQNITYHQAVPYKGILATQMKTILQTIQERSSIPSMEESQMNQMRQISSKATIRSNLYENGSPLSNKHTSMIMKQSLSKQSFRMINSENLHEVNEAGLMAVMAKLEKDNQMLQRQYKALLQQQSHLVLQKEFNRNRFNRQLAFLQQIQQQYQHKLDHYKSIIHT